MLRDVAMWLLAGAGVALQGLVCLGVTLMRDALDRLHYTAASTLGVTCLCGAVLVRDPASLIGLKTLLTGAFLLVTGPVLVHATARAIHLHSDAEARR